MEGQRTTTISTTAEAAAIPPGEANLQQQQQQQQQRSPSGGRLTIQKRQQQRPAHSVFAELGLWERVSQYQDGEQGSDFWNGDVAAAEGHFELMLSKHLRGDPLSYTHLGLSRASRNGRMDVVRWLHDYTDVPRMPSAMDSAAAGGHLEVCWEVDMPPGPGCTVVSLLAITLQSTLYLVGIHR